MIIQQLERHKLCPHYIGNTSVGFKIVHMQGGESQDVNYHFNTMAFILKGSMTVTSDEFDTLQVNANELYAIPAGLPHQLHVKEDIEFLRLYIIGENLEFCQRIVGNIKVDNYEFARNHITAMPMCPVIKLFAEQVTTYVKDKLLCCDIHKLKQRELAALLQAYYETNTLKHFLVPMYNYEDSFHNKVHGLAPHFLHINQMAERLNMSRATFVRNFNTHFHETPQQWLTRYKAKALFNALRNTTDSLDEIAQKLHFSSQQAMNTFCKKNLQATPLEIRQGEGEIGG